jgi:hypothetical protein
LLKKEFSLNSQSSYELNYQEKDIFFYGECSLSMQILLEDGDRRDGLQMLMEGGGGECSPSFSGNKDTMYGELPLLTPTTKAILEMRSTPHKFDSYPSKSYYKDGESSLSISITFRPFFVSGNFCSLCANP